MGLQSVLELSGRACLHCMYVAAFELPIIELARTGANWRALARTGALKRAGAVCVAVRYRNMSDVRNIV